MRGGGNPKEKQNKRLPYVRDWAYGIKKASVSEF